MLASRWLAAFLAALVALVLPISGGQAAEQIVPLIDYNNYPPIIIDQKAAKGMLWDLAALLTRRSHGTYRFVAEEMPRKRLDIDIEAGKGLAVPFVDGGFFDDAKHEKYLWTRPIFVDRQEIVSPADRPIEYAGPQSLRGKVFGGVLGRIYGPLEPAFRSGEIARSDAFDEISSVLKVGTGRVDVGSISAMALQYYRSDPRVASLHVSAQPLYQIERRVMVVGLPAVCDFIDTQLAELGADDWNALLQAY